jgi:uncharacterized protein YggE
MRTHTFLRKPALVAGAALLSTAALLGASAPSASAADTRYIAVSATGTIKVRPDAVRLNLTVSSVATANKDALAAANTSATAIRTALAANGIAAQYLKSAALTVFPEYNYTADKGSVLIGYRASQTFEVIIRSAANAGVVIDAVVAAGGDPLQIDGVTPFVFDPSAASEAARVAAVKSAQAKAASYAKLLGVKLGKVIYLEETSVPTTPGLLMAMAKSDAGATQVDLGTQDLSVSVATRWLIS